MHPHQLRTVAVVALTAFAMVVLAAPAPAQQDLRSPDARDAALISQGLMEQHAPSTIVVERPVPAPAPAAGFEWLDAAIGAAFALAIALLGTAAALATRRRTHGALS